MERIRNIYLKAEKVRDDEYHLYVTNDKNEEILMPYDCVVYNDHKGRFIENINSAYYKLNTTDNYTIYYKDAHVMDFSHFRLWKV